MKKYQVTPSIARRSRSIYVGAPDTDKHILLGRLSEVGPEKSIHLDVGQEHVIAVVGKRGSGKTHTLGVLLEGLGASDPTGILGINNTEHAVLVFDTLNLFQWMGIPLESAGGPLAKTQLSLAHKWGLPLLPIKPRLWHLAGVNPVSQNSTPFVVQVSDMSPQDWGLLMDIDTVSEPMGQLIAAAYDKVTRTGWRTDSKRIEPVTKYSIAELINCISEDVEIEADFAPDTRRAIRQRLSAYERTGLFSTEGTSLNEVIGPGEVSVMLLGRIPEDLRTLVAFLIIRRLLDQRSAASEAAKDSAIRGVSSTTIEVPKAWVVIDEAQNIVPSRTASIANRELARFVREGRNFGLSMVVSTQQPTAIDARVMAQVDILMAHTLTVKQDVTYIMANLKAAPPDSIILRRRSFSLSDALRELEVGQCLISAVESQRTLFTEIRPRVTPHGGFEA